MPVAGLLVWSAQIITLIFAISFGGAFREIAFTLALVLAVAALTLTLFRTDGNTAETGLQSFSAEPVTSGRRAEDNDAPQPAQHHFAPATGTGVSPLFREARARADRNERDAQAQAWVALMQQVNHDLRTPLNAVMGFTDLMRGEVYGPLGSPRYQEYLDDIRSSSERLLQKTEQTIAMTNALTMAPEARDAMTPVCPHEMAHSAWRRVEADLAPAGFSFGVVGDPDSLMADAASLEHAMANLILEAAARSDHRGKLLCILTAEHETIRLEVLATAAARLDQRELPSLNINIARVLLEMQGTQLLVMNRPGQIWRAVTSLDRAAQEDLFEGHGERSAA